MSLSLQMRPFRLPLRAALGTAHGRQVAVEGLRLLLRDASGGFGLGEVTPLPHFGTESLQQAVQALGTLRLHRVPEGVEDVSEAFSLVGRASATRAGVEMALLDLVARRRGLPLAQLLGSARLRPVPVNALLRGETAEEVVQEARSAVALGFRTLKLKVGALSVQGDVERLVAVREAVGGAIALRADANGAWTEAEARQRLSPLVPLGLEYVEQPVAAGDVAGLRRLRTLLPVAADEALGLEGAAAALLEAKEGPAADVLILKLPVLGGLLSALRLGTRARARQVGAVVTSAMDGAVGRAAGGHLALALGGGRAHGLATGALLLEDPGAHPVLRGALQLTDEPGLGIAPEALGW
ncbi:MAG: mandelate racemase/muconate lactonizing enzyme family protein [Myxococcaceae bacterium]